MRKKSAKRRSVTEPDGHFGVPHAATLVPRIRRVAHVISEENGASRSGLTKDHGSSDVETWNDLKSN